jgi:putative transposase
MREILFPLLYSLSCGLRTRTRLHLEIIALRHQLGVLQRRVPTRPKLKVTDRWLWVALSRLWSGWRSSLVIVKPGTVVAWHRKGFRLYWTWKSRQRTGRPKINTEVRELIQKMSRENPLWGAPRIHGEVLKLGIDISQATVAKYRVRKAGPPSQSWRTFLDNHVSQLASIDFFTVPTIWFEVLFVFVVLAHDRRRVLHFNVTAHPTAAWTAQQILEAFPFETAPKYLLRDRDALYGFVLRQQIEGLGITEVLGAPRSPWQRAYVERMIGSIRRDCLDHVIVFEESSLHRILGRYLDYYHDSRTHLSLDKDAPTPRPVQPAGRIVALPQLGGLHHRYERRAA